MCLMPREMLVYFIVNLKLLRELSDLGIFSGCSVARCSAVGDDASLVSSFVTLSYFHFIRVASAVAKPVSDSCWEVLRFNNCRPVPRNRG